MKLVIQFLVSAIICFPIILFSITYAICYLRKKNVVKCFGYSADATTFILLFSVPLSISSVWGLNYYSIVFVIEIVIAIIFTYIDWRTKKEIEILPLLKKIWRLYFILLTIAYIVIWIVGLIQSIIDYTGN